MNNTSIQNLFHESLTAYNTHDPDEMRKALDGFKQIITLEMDAGHADTSESYWLRMAHARVAQIFARLQAPERGMSYDADNAQDCMVQAIQSSCLAMAASCPSPLPMEKEKKIRGLVFNALGLVALYQSDNPELTKKRKHFWLDYARAQFENAQRDGQDGWENTFELALTCMRLGVLTQNKHMELDKAESLLRNVFENLWPGHVEAHYEMGRLQRWRGRFDDALHSFSRVIQTPDNLRNVRTAQIENEMAMARNQDARVSPETPDKRTQKRKQA